MEYSLILAAMLIGGYLLGSIPTAVWIGKSFHNIDVRDHGSKNAGSTNAIRVLGLKTGIIVLIIDAFKGIAAVNLVLIFPEIFPGENTYVMFKLLLGVMALLGHIFPIFAGFRGGKGIATLAGIVIALFPGTVLISLGVFALIFLITRIVSLGSIIASITFPIIIIFFDKEAVLAEMIFSVVVAVFVPLTHRKNIYRLLKGEENKLHFGKKNQNK
ncbi:MAG: glycerol-3-phosphate 1-O-acyltransferase PlsY [Bacteroidetes bacterium]|nr:glycerol-3-phosphate 1-O-acyltransferase PlsY [Bacteroidota bacterium]